MAIYAVGDLQGCFQPLLKLLERLHFKPGKDQLWLVGDLVNRGPQSLEVLRFVRSLGDSAKVVLGNHDLNLLAVAYGDRNHHPRDTLRAILKAPDREPLLDWLRQQPLLHHDKKLGITMVHAGLPPQWDLKTAQHCASKVEKMLSGKHCSEFLLRMYGNKPSQWDKSLHGWAKLRFTTNALTRIRYCSKDGHLDMDNHGPIGSQPKGLMPWFKVPGRASKDLTLVFGHWSTLGTIVKPGLIALDSGCVWGGQLTAIRLDKPGKLIAVRCPG